MSTHTLTLLTESEVCFFLTTDFHIVLLDSELKQLKNSLFLIEKLLD